MSRRGNPVLDFDLNLAPIIDCFTVLITFMLASASFLAVTIFDAGFAPADAVGDPKPPAITVSVVVKDKDQGYKLEVKGKMTLNQTFKTPEDLAETLKTVKSKFADTSSVTLSADDNVEYEKLVKAMEKMRPIIPGLILGGF